GVAQAVTEEVEGQQRYGERQSRKEKDVGIEAALQRWQSLVGHPSPVRLGRRDAEAEKTEERRREDRNRNHKGRLHDDRAQRVGKDVPEQDLPPSGAPCPSRLEELSLSDAQGLSPRQSRHVHPDGALE